ncbi:MAG: PEP-utilizing enzyme [archaeon]
MDEFSFIEKDEWYLQGTDYCSLFGYSIWSAGYQTFGANKAITYNRKNHGRGFFSLSYYHDELKPLLKRQMNDGRIIDKLFSNWQVQLTKLRQILKQMGDMAYDSEKICRIKLLVGELDRCNQLLWKKSFVSEMADAVGWELMAAFIAEEGFDIRDCDLVEMTKGYRIPYLLDLEMKLRRAAQKKDNLQISSIANEYFFVKTGWGHVYTLTPKDFSNELREYKNMDPGKIKTLENYSVNVRKRRDQLIRKYRMNGRIINLFHFFSVLADWRDIRKKYAQMVNNYLYYAAERIGREYKIPVILLLDSYPQELSKLPDKLDAKQKRQWVAELRARKKLNVLHLSRGDVQIITGNKAEIIANRIEGRFSQQHKEVRGHTGNPGTVKGRVRVILGDNDFGKMTDGAIIVAPMTRPEYTPLMKMASAIITDEGGVTCHAAIVSRELGIPCIIGTQVATKMLKDGMLVYVDASKGIVRKC